MKTPTILVSLKTWKQIELFQKGIGTDFGVSLLFSMRSVSLALALTLTLMLDQCKRDLNLFQFSIPAGNDQLLDLGSSIVDVVQLACHRTQVKLFLSSSTFHFCSEIAKFSADQFHF